MKKLLLSVVMVCSTVMLFYNCTGKSKNASSDDMVLTKDQLVQRGNYLVTTYGCSDCHAPKRMGPKGPEIITELMLSGYQANIPLAQIDKSVLQKGWLIFTADFTGAVGPWGVSFAGNITSDSTGIGNWPEENFIKAITQGKLKGIDGGRSLLPPMPWQNLAKMTIDDKKAMFAFLKTTKAVHNIVPAAIAPADIK